MNHETAGAAITGLKEYVRQVAFQIGDDAWGFDCDVEVYPILATIYVRSNLPTLPLQQLLLTWDEVNGWALRVALDDKETTAITYLGRDLLAKPHDVAAFLRACAQGRNPGTLSAPHLRDHGHDDDLEARLAHFA